MKLFRKHGIGELSRELPREELKRKGRLLIIDDEKPMLIDDLKKSGFAVDHYEDITKNNINIVESNMYDLILLDFGNVGREFGDDQGLSLLRHIKRVSPSTIVYAYTAKALSASQSDFYKLSDGVLRKDAGIAESMEKIEDGLRSALGVANIWQGVLSSLRIKPGSEDDKKLQHRVVLASKSKKKMDGLKNEILVRVGYDPFNKIVMPLLGKLLEVALLKSIGL